MDCNLTHAMHTGKTHFSVFYQLLNEACKLLALNDQAGEYFILVIIISQFTFKTVDKFEHFIDRSL